MTAQIDKLHFAEGSAPATPPSGIVAVYAKTDGLMYQMDDAGSEAAMAAAGGATVYPYHADIPGNLWPVTSVNFAPGLIGGNDIGITAVGAAAQNDEAVYRILLAAGTWRLDVYHFVRTARGIYTFAIDTDGASYTDIGTLDGYAASPSTGIGTFTQSAITGITVPTDGLWFFRFKMATKNASSAGYSGLILQMCWTRTGA